VVIDGVALDVTTFVMTAYDARAPSSGPAGRRLRQSRLAHLLRGREVSTVIRRAGESTDTPVDFVSGRGGFL
jgi:hypothetical protein